MRPARRSGAVSSTAGPAPRDLRPCPHGDPIKAAPPPAYGKSVCSRAGVRTSLLSDQRRKLSFASELNLVSFYWLEVHQAGGPMLGTDLGGFGNIGKSVLPMLGLLPCHSSRAVVTSLVAPSAPSEPQFTSWWEAELFPGVAVTPSC